MLQRAVRYSDNSLHYEVTAAVIARGSVLPFVELFVIQINDPLNPKSDVLARVSDPLDIRSEAGVLYVKVDSADLRTFSTDPFVRVPNIDELTALPRDRVTAVRRGASVYLASTVSKIYDTLSTADAAGRQIIDRLSKLTQDYVTFYGTFLSNPATVYSLPVTSRSVEAVLTAGFVAKRQTRLNAETATATARTALDVCRTADAMLDARIDALVADVAFLEAARVIVAGIAETSSPVTAGVSGTTNARAFALDGSNPRSYESLLVEKRAALSETRVTRTARDAGCAALAQTAANADAALEAARAAETESLREVYASCPTFNPNTV